MKNLDDLSAKNWRRAVRPGSARAYAIAVAFVGVATALRWALGFLGPEIAALPTFYPAIFFAALIGGFGPGVFATFLSGALAWWAFMTPFTSFFPIKFGPMISLASFFVACVVIVWGADSYRALTRRLEEADELRNLVIEELTHRLKNKLATIQSVVSFQLRAHPDIRATIENRLISLSATDDLIRAANGLGAQPRAIFETELSPYDLSRVSVTGQDCFLPPKLALSMALVAHELSTNAAKYGSLSSAAGKVRVYWTLSNGLLSVEWRETGGPPVAPPSHQGFGTRLLSRALGQFEGGIETSYETTGLVARMTVRIPIEETTAIAPSP